MSGAPVVAAPAMVSVRGVIKRYGAFTALDEVDLDVARGERVVICGPSGSGKSTLISCLNGLVRHDAGRVVVDGIEVSYDGGTYSAVRQRVGMVFQQFNLFPHMTVLENCLLGPRVHGRDPKRSRELALSTLAQMRMDDQLHKRPAQLSGGQQQRAAIARALTMQPELMLFDEPTSSLDPELVHEVLDAMRALATTGMTMIVVTHEMGFARAVADRIVYMEAGRIVEQAGAEAFFTRPQNEGARLFLSRVLGGQRAALALPLTSETLP